MVDSVRIDDVIDDRYKVTETLGQGGMAIVYKAHDLITDKDVAVKIMRQETAADRINLNRFEREARAAASLNHQNIVKVVNVGTFHGIPYMINEFVDGQNLREVLDVRGKFSFVEALDIMYQLCSAVMYAHEHGVIHRDIKPQNIFFTRDGTIKLGDFGIATFQNAGHVTRSESIVGSVHYIAPEVAEGGNASIRSDIYSMGITFFELITGRVPFDADNQVRVAIMQVKERFPNIRKFNPKTPECVEKIIYKAVSKDPKNRYADASMMRKDVENILLHRELLNKKPSFFYSLFHPNAKTVSEKKEEKKQRKALKENMKKNKEEKNDGK